MLSIYVGGLPLPRVYAGFITSFAFFTFLDDCPYFLFFLMFKMPPPPPSLSDLSTLHGTEMTKEKDSHITPLLQPYLST